MRKWIKGFATGLGAGYLPLAPGTWGSAEAVLLVYLLHRWVPAPWFWWTLVGFTLLFAVGGTWAATQVSIYEADSDPHCVVVDELAGQALTFLWAPVTPLSLLIGFLLFRFFDIVKPCPARRAEFLPGGVGIVADDLIAGTYSGIALWLLHRYAHVG